MALKYCPFSRSAGGDLWKHRVTYAVFGSRRLVGIKLWSLSRRLSLLDASKLTTNIGALTWKRHSCGERDVCPLYHRNIVLR
jgi:hypothetical protein